MLPEVTKDTPTFIFSFSGSVSGQRKVPGGEIFLSLTGDRKWYIPRLARDLREGGRVLLYQSTVGIVADGLISSVSPISATDSHVLQRLGMVHLRFRVDFSEIVTFKTPVKIGDIVHDLDFVSNKKHWGHSVRFCPRKIPADDYAKILVFAVMGGSRQRQPSG